MGIEPVTLDLPDPEGSEDFVTGGQELAELVRQNDRLFPWIKRLLVDEVPAAIEPTRQALREFRPGVLVVDPMIYQGIIAAHLEEIPYVCPSSSLNPVTPADLDVSHNRNMKALDPARKALFAEYGMNPEFRVADCLSPFANTVFATREYVGDVEAPPKTFLVGPSMPPDGRPETESDAALPDDGKPLLYVSFGSQIYYQPEIFELVAETTEAMGVHVLLVCGPLALSDWARTLPPHVTAVGFAPQLEVLPRAAAVVTHGGANTVMESLYNGVPLLISPVCNDQTMQAHFLEKRGAGLVLDLNEASDEEARIALSRILEPDSPERRAAREVSESYKEHDGARNAAELVEEFL